MKTASQLAVMSFAALIFSSDYCCSARVLGGEIQSQGEAVLERKPEFMRMTVDLLAKGDTMADAVAKMKTRRAKVEQQLVALGATKDTWKFGEIRLDQKQKSRRQQLQMIINQRVGLNAGRIPKDKDAEAGPTPVDLAMKLTAEWSISDADPTENLVTVQKLQEAIRAANLSGSEDADDTSEEAAELAEEMEGITINGTTVVGGYYPASLENPGEQKAGEATFVFVGKISAADRQKAMTEAFLAAKANATLLADAAQVALGSLRNLSDTTSHDSDELSDDQVSVYGQVYNPALRQQLMGRDHANEAIGTSLGTLKYKVSVSATFEFK